MSAEWTPELKNWLVSQAESILDNITDENYFRGQTSTSQLRNLLQITQTESEVPVLRNFIRYQTGRKATQRFWHPIYKPVIDVLEEIERRTGNRAELRRQAIANFFGYLVRHYVYLSEVQPPRVDQRVARQGRSAR